MAAMSWRTFARSWFGLVVLLIVGVLALAGTLFYLGPYLAILTLLIFGLALPIFLGQRGLKPLAILGIATLVITAPVFTVIYTDELRVPTPAVTSNGAAPYGNGQPVIQDALVTPFVGAAGGLYNFSATIYPQYLPVNTTITNVTFYVTDCPGATSNSSPDCGSSYPFYTDTIQFGANPAAPTVVSYSRNLPGTDIWWWDLEAVVEDDASPHNLTGIWLDYDGSYSGIEGPVSGSFGSVVLFLLPTAYEVVFIYPGIVFLIALLFYAFLKGRERNRKGAGPSQPTPTDGTPTPAGAPPGAAGGGSPGATEMRCPNCQAVVYPNETTCWKCGKSLAPAQPASSAPLASSKSP